MRGGKAVKHIHDSKEYAEAIRSGSVIVDFAAKWCPPCRQMEPIYEQLAQENKGITFLHVDVDESKDIASAEGIEAMPTFVFYVNGKRRDDMKLRGANVAGLKAAISKLPKTSQAFQGEGHR